MCLSSYSRTWNWSHQWFNQISKLLETQSCFAVAEPESSFEANGVSVEGDKDQGYGNFRESKLIPKDEAGLQL